MKVFYQEKVFCVFGLQIREWEGGGVDRRQNRFELKTESRPVLKGRQFVKT
jgi:hypothetical protein